MDDGSEVHERLMMIRRIMPVDDDIRYLPIAPDPNMLEDIAMRESKMPDGYLERIE